MQLCSLGCMGRWHRWDSAEWHWGTGAHVDRSPSCVQAVSGLGCLVGGEKERAAVFELGRSEQGIANSTHLGCRGGRAGVSSAPSGGCVWPWEPMSLYAGGARVHSPTPCHLGSWSGHRGEGPQCHVQSLPMLPLP